jgi:MFS family permease
MTVTGASWVALFRGRYLAYTLLLTLGVGVHALGIHLVATVLPSVVADIGGAAFYAWATMLYIVASIMGTACGGQVRARLDLRRGYVSGALILLAGWLGCAVAPHIAILLTARAIQGVGSGLLVALAYSMVSEFYAEAQRPRALSAISAIWGIAALLGPMIGGVFAVAGWWRGAFWAAIPILILLTGMAWYTLPVDVVNGGGGDVPALRLSLLGAGVLCVALSGHVALITLRVMLVGSAVALLGLAFRLDAHAANRLLPSQPLSLRTLVGRASWMFLLFGLTTGLVTVFTPLILHVLHGVSLLSAGYVNAVLSLAWTALALWSASLRDRQVRRVVVLGPLLILAGAVGLRACIVDGPLAFLAIFMVMIGAGIGTCFAHISSWTMAAARPREEAVTAASIPTIQALGIAFGAAIAGLVANAAGLAAGISAATVAAAASWVYLLGIVPPAVLVVLSVGLVSLHWKQILRDADAAEGAR